MRNTIKALAAANLLLASGATFAVPTDYDFSGTFTYDNDVVLLDFTVDADSTITIFSSSWDDGGFDPILAIWDSAGVLIEEQDDGRQSGTALSNGVSYNYGVWDSYYSVDLAAGSYTASIVQYDNFAAGSNLAQGFIHDSDPDFTSVWGTQDYFNGVDGDCDFETGYCNDPRTGDWAFHLLNVATADERERNVPEPATLALLGLGLFGVSASRRAKPSMR